MLENLPPDQVSFLIQYLANIASDLTSAGISRLSTHLRPKNGARALESTDIDQLRLQSVLVEAGITERSGQRISKFLRTTGSLSHLMYLAYVANSDEIRVVTATAERTSYGNAFHQELRAHLALEAELVEGPDLDRAVELVGMALTQAAQRQIERSGKASLSRSADRPSALFLFGQSQVRASLVASLGNPSLAAMSTYTTRYLSALRASYSELQLQHLDPSSPPVLMSEIYVEPTLSDVPNPQQEIARRTYDESCDEELLKVRQALTRSTRTVILGPAGAGKSTLVRHSVGLVAEDSKGECVPFVVELKNFQLGTGLGLFRDFLESQVTGLVQQAPPPGWIDYLLLTGRATVFFDGFDEVLSTVDRSLVRDAVLAFASLYTGASIVVTSRINGYQSAPLSSQEFAHSAINDLDDAQVADYAERWFRMRKRAGFGHDYDRLAPFLKETSRHAADLRSNPLMLSLLCGVYYHQGDIPHTLSELYERCAALMFQQWNTMRGLDDPGVWTPDLRAALAHVAQTLLGSDEHRRHGIAHDQLVRLLSDYFRETQSIDVSEAMSTSRRLVESWSGRAWVLTEIERTASGVGVFGFVHQSFLEYFAAIGIVRESSGPESLYRAVRHRIVFLNGWSVAQIVVAYYQQFQKDGASHFATALLDDVMNGTTWIDLQLLMFCVELRELLWLTPSVDARLTRFAIEYYVRSMTVVDPGMNLHAIHERTRAVAPLIDDDDWDEISSLEPGVLEGAQVTSLESERVVATLMAQSIQSRQHFTSLLTELPKLATWEDKPGETFVSIAMTLQIAQAQASARSRTPTSFDPTSAALLMSNLYKQVSTTDPYWPAHAAAFALGLITDVEAAHLVPWNAAVAREAIVLSLIVDFDLPCVFRGDVIDEALFALDSGVIAGIGSSLLEDLGRIGSPPFWPVSTEDWEQMIDMTWSGQGGSDWISSAWDEKRIAGMFVLLGVAKELDPSLRLLSFETREMPNSLRILLRALSRDQALNLGPVGPRVKISDLGSAILVKAVKAWRKETFSFTA